MEEIADIHNHILFDVDDGSKTFEQSQNMLDMAYNEGIRTIILTPHHNPYRWHNTITELRAKYKILREYCMDNYPKLDLYLGNEIYYGEDTLEELNNKKILTMADSRYVLVEFSPSAEYRYIKHAVMDIQQSGYYPIVAHVERYECLLSKSGYIDELKELGAFIQVNASAIMGERNRIEKKFTNKLLKHENVDFVATDAHRDNVRTPRIKSCMEYVIKKYGNAYAKRIFNENPSRVINDEYIEDY